MGSFFDIWDVVETLYLGSGGGIYHGYNKTYGEILLEKSNGTQFIIADRNIGASSFGEAGDYIKAGSGTAPTGYKIPTKSNADSLVLFYKNITSNNVDNVSEHLLMPYSGYKGSSGDINGTGLGYSWTSTVLSNRSDFYYALVHGTSASTGNKVFVVESDSTNLSLPVRPFKK